MNKMKFFSRLFVVFKNAFIIALLFFIQACSREVNSSKTIHLVVPAKLQEHQKGQVNSLARIETLDVVIINARNFPAGSLGSANPPTPPKVWTFSKATFGAVDATGKLSIIVEGDIPTTPTLLVQYLGVYKSDTGAMRFSYGDAVVDATVFGDINVNILANTVGSSLKEGRVGGRYLTSVSSGTALGPTGDLLTLFIPYKLAAGTNMPPMEVDRSQILNGWFSIMAFDGSANTGDANFRYRVLRDDGTTEDLFANETGNLNLSGGLFNGTSTNAVISKVVVPPSFTVEHNSALAKVRALPERELIAGYFRIDPASVTGTPWSNYVACYPDVQQSLPQLFLDNTLVTPLNYRAGSVTLSDARNVGSATIGSSAVCTNPAFTFSSSLKIYQERFRDGHDDAFGIRGPFAIIDETQEYDRAFVQTTIDESGAFPKVLLSWKYLPGVVNDGANGKGVDGISLFSKFDPTHNGGGGGSDDLNCAQRAAFNGFQLASDIPAYDLINPGNIEKYLLVNPPGFANFTFPINAAVQPKSSVTEYQFMLCPYRLLTSGIKKFVNEGLQAQCFDGRCNYQKNNGFGTKIPGGGTQNGVVQDLTLTASSAFSSISSYTRVLGVAANANSNDLDLLVPTGLNSTFSIGDEVLAVVMAASAAAGPPITTACGSYLGKPILPGQHVLLSVKDNTITDTVTVAGDNFISKMAGDTAINTALNVTTNSVGHCFLQLVKVPSYGDVNLNSSVTLSADSFDGGVTSTAGGGVIALRASGTLTLNANSIITAKGTGFSCAGTNCDGEGPLTFSALNKNSGNLTTTAGGGGAHYGISSGGNGGDSLSSVRLNGRGHNSLSSAFGTGSFFDDFHFLIGSAGGGSGSTQVGGRGGGFVFIFARNISVAGPGAVIEASGVKGTDATSLRPGGGGGGGTIYLFSEKITTGANVLLLNAKGGDAGNGTIANVSGGGGGGGYIALKSCSTTGTPVPPVLTDVSGGARSSANIGGEDLNNISEAGTSGTVNALPPTNLCPP